MSNATAGALTWYGRMLRTPARKRFTRDQSVSLIRAYDRAGQPMRVASVAQ